MVTFVHDRTGNIMNRLQKESLSRVLQIPVGRVEELLEVSFKIIYSRNEMIDAPRGVFDRLGYIIDGAVRTYHVAEDGHEISYLLQVNGDFLGDYESYITGKPSNLTIEAILKTEVLFFERKGMEELIEKDIFWLHFSKKISDFVFLDAKRRLDDLLFYTPEERYKRLMDKSHELLQKIPQKYISTYLGITPQSLSRIRRRMLHQQQGN